jgi:methylsterol monooxygenase
LGQLFYFGRCIPWAMVDRIPYFRKYKLQPVCRRLWLSSGLDVCADAPALLQDKVASAQQQWQCTRYVLYTHFTIELPQIWAFHPLAEYFGIAMHEVPFPKWTKILAQVALFFVLEDTWHYWTHR